MPLDILNNLLTETLSRGATDLHICVGSPPLMRINSKLEKIPGTHALSIDEVTEIVNSSLDFDKMDILRKNKVIDFSYSKSGFGRFRCNIY